MSRSEKPSTTALTAITTPIARHPLPQPAGSRDTSSSTVASADAGQCRAPASGTMNGSPPGACRTHPRASGHHAQGNQHRTTPPADLQVSSERPRQAQERIADERKGHQHGGTANQAFAAG